MSEPVAASADALDGEKFNALLRNRYGASWSPTSETMDAPVNDVIETLLNHRSVRTYSARPLPADR